MKGLLLHKLCFKNNMTGVIAMVLVPPAVKKICSRAASLLAVFASILDCNNQILADNLHNTITVIVASHCSQFRAGNRANFHSFNCSPQNYAWSELVLIVHDKNG